MPISFVTLKNSFCFYLRPRMTRIMDCNAFLIIQLALDTIALISHFDNLYMIGKLM